MTVPDCGGLDLDLPWINDLRWHRAQYRQSRFQWSATEALLAATEFTHGRQDFSSLMDLRELNQNRRAAAEYAAVCQRAFGDAVRQARLVICPTSWVTVALELDSTVADCSASSHFSTWSIPADRTNAQVDRVQRIVDGLYFSNPLIRAWELKQLWDLYTAAESILEDTVVDLVGELSGHRRPQDIADAIGVCTSAGLEHRIRIQRSQRGLVGDPRRTPHQYR